MKRTKRKVKFISKVVFRDISPHYILFYAAPDEKVYAIYIQLPEHVPIEFVLVECFGLHYDYNKDILLKDVQQGNLIIREPILKSEQNIYLRSYKCPNTPLVQSRSTVTELVDYLCSKFHE